MIPSANGDDSKRLSLVHISPTREDHGGIQSSLWLHRAHETGLGCVSRFLSLFDRTTSSPEDCRSLGVHGWMPVSAIRRRFARAAQQWNGSIFIYHDGWGLRWFAPQDHADRRIVFLHTEVPNADLLIRDFGPLVDGFLSVSRSYIERVRRVDPDFPEERLCALPYFIEAPAWLADAVAARSDPQRPLRLGYAGRVVRQSKRLDRLPAFIEALVRRGIDFQFEVMGDGRCLPALRRRLETCPNVSFLGWRSGDDYWRKLTEWDVVVFLSDYEGFSRAAMECMRCGVIPVHPDFSPAAGELLGPAAPVGLYPTGDVVAAAEKVASIAAMPSETIRELRHSVAEHLCDHNPENYFRLYVEFLRRISALPTRVRMRGPPVWEGAVPLGIYTRLFPGRF